MTVAEIGIDISGAEILWEEEGFQAGFKGTLLQRPNFLCAWRR